MPGANAIMVGEAFVPITADDSPIQQSMNRTRARVRGFTRSVGRSFAKVGRAIQAAFGALLKVGKVLAVIGTGGAVAMAALVRSFALFGDRLAKTADKLGVSIVALNELRFAAERSGVEVRTFDMGLQRFIRRAAEAAQGTGEAKDALKQLGIQLTDNQGNLRPAEDLLGDVADAFSKLESQADRVRLAFKLFDSEGVAFVNILAQGKKGIDTLRRESRRLNPVTEEQARLAEELTDRFLDFRTAMLGVRNVLATSLGPAFIAILEQLREFFVEMRASIGVGNELAITFLRLQGTVRKIAVVFADWIRQMKEGLDVLADGIEALGLNLRTVRRSLELGLGTLLSRRARDEIAKIEKDTLARIEKVRKETGKAVTPGVTAPGLRPGGAAAAKGGGVFGAFTSRLLSRMLPTQAGGPIGERIASLNEKQLGVLEKMKTVLNKIAVGGGAFGARTAAGARIRLGQLPQTDEIRNLLARAKELQDKLAFAATGVARARPGTFVPPGSTVTGPEPFVKELLDELKEIRKSFEAKFKTPIPVEVGLQ